MFNSARFTTFLALLLTAIPISSYAEFDPTLFAHDARIQNTFKGPERWKGHVLVNGKGIKTIVWETPEGMTVIGRVFDNTQRDLTAIAEKKHQTAHLKVNLVHPIGVPKDRVHQYREEDNSKHIQVYDKLANELSDEYYVTTGNGEHEVYVFFDYRCVHCKNLKSQLDRRSDVTVHWLPVSMLAPDSLIYGAAILEKLIPFDKIAPSVSVGNQPTPSQASQEAVIYNTALLGSMSDDPRKVYTPTLMYQRGNKEVALVPGNPKATDLDKLFE